MATDPSVPTPPEREQWLNAVDHRVTLGVLTPQHFRLAWRIAKAYVNSKTGTAWPSQERLAADMGLTARTVQALIAGLRKAGLLTIERPSRNDSNIMRLDLTHALLQPQRASLDRHDSSSRHDDTTGKILPVEPERERNHMRYIAWLTGKPVPVREEE